MPASSRQAAAPRRPYRARHALDDAYVRLQVLHSPAIPSLADICAQLKPTPVAPGPSVAPVDIVIPVHDGLSHLRCLLGTLFEHTDPSTLPRATVTRDPSGKVQEIPRVISKPVSVRRLPEAGGEVIPPPPSAGRPVLRLQRQFPGMPFSAVFPPDPNGDVGQEHYVQLTNSRTGRDCRPCWFRPWLVAARW
jgi:hypothetical protein